MKEDRLSFTSDGRVLQGVLRLPDVTTPVPCVVLCHGFGSYDDDLGGFVRLAELLAQAGTASFCFSFSGSHPYPDHGDADESVPLDHSRQVYARAAGPKTLEVLAGAAHCPWETTYEARVQQLARQWFEQWL
jgi:fermentation-respiration switch protein FrsA (DUF1100 family)